ncbi:D-alanyl-D-alanine carboxypeptidase/D-alanyl-D-alanine endopeptidase [Flexithrix dorotheae]|uniref:D-alanyl-D-alanine carboxypeptidase/D-alanyl-D-alanine endopeptidase n=1 Tax=Flexithrix dorotheae TaxID=70993 RepID=UPI00037E9454|nr:D-alanyl-D-alanine carboxypeptidase/D-alanyl-D-alanine-endopeptidase [Flexithrix dorotheae]
MLYKNLLLFSIFLFSALQLKTSNSQTPITESKTTVSDLKVFLDDLQKDPEMKGSLLSFYLTSSTTNEPLMDYNADLGMATASTMKAITTATGYEVLGADFKFETNLEYDGVLTEDGTLNGNVYIRGGGDPTLGSDNMPSLMDFFANRIIEKGIRKINGAVIGDASIFETQMTPDSWTWDDMGNYYGAGASGLCINENQYRLFFKTGANEGDPTTIMGMEPKIPGLNFKNEIITGKKGSGDNAYIYGGEYSYERNIRGTLPPNYSDFMIKGSIPDPALFCADRLKFALEAKNISVSHAATTCRISGKTDKTRINIYTHHSAPYNEIIKETNFESVNLFAEAIFKMIGYKLKGEGSNAKAEEAIKEYWEAKGIDMTGVFLEDGSGLSRFNLISARQMAEILKLTYQNDEAKYYYYSLPLVGKYGTVKYMGKGTAADGRIRSKSGYIRRVRGYTGYVNTLSGKKLIFSVLINNYSKSYRDLTRDFEKLMDMMARL